MLINWKYLEVEATKLEGAVLSYLVSIKRVGQEDRAHDDYYDKVEAALRCLGDARTIAQREVGGSDIGSE